MILYLPLADHHALAGSAVRSDISNDLFSKFVLAELILDRRRKVSNFKDPNSAMKFLILALISHAEVSFLEPRVPASFR